MQNFKLFVFFLLISSINCSAQSIWKTLANVTYKTRFDAVLKYEVDYPVFSEEIKSKAGKVVEVKGYMVPLEEYQGHNFFVLSALPYNICFFCGAAGPETVMEIYTKSEIEYSDKPIRLRGVLELNDNNYDHLMYMLKDAQQIEP